MPQHYYIYIHAYPSNHPEKPNQIFYVGKGSRKRYLIQRRNNSHHQNILDKLFRAEYVMKDIAFIIKDNLSESISLFEEIKLIKEIGRIDLKTGTLVNMTDGGEGGSGYIYSQETRDKISKSLTGHIVSQKTRDKLSKARQNISQETKDKISKANTIKKPTKDKLYNLYTTQKLTQEEIGKIYNVNSGTIRKWMRHYSIHIRTMSEAVLLHHSKSSSLAL